MEDGALNSLPSRRFGRLGWSVRPIGLGGAWLRGRKHERSLEEGAQLVVESVRLGVDFIDTSIRYGDSELVIGEALKLIPEEQRPRIATKSQVIRDGDIAAGVYESCQRSLERLGLQKLDLFQLHEVEMYGWDKIMGPGGAFDGLKRCRHEGLCEGIGVTGRPPDLLAQLVDTGEFDSVLTYYEYDLVTAEASRDLLPLAEQHDVAVIAGSVARMGLFARPNEDAWRKQPSQVQQRRPHLESLFGKPIYELADESLRYVLADPRISTVVVGASQLETLERSIEAARLGPLDLDVRMKVRAICGVPYA